MIYIILLVVAAAFAVAALTGAPYLPVLGRDVDSLLDLADLKPGQHLVDLGSGDGKLLIAAAKRGIRATGYEINPVLWLIAVIRCYRYRKLVRVYCRDFWHITWPEAQAIYVFLIDHYMSKLDAKAQRDITKPTKIVSYVFKIPGRRPVKTTKNSYVYAYPLS
jgi:hypothetical protein